MSTKYRYPSELLYEATALADGDWVVVQKAGESRLSKITGANFGNISALAKTDGNIIVGDGTKWVAESGSTARASLGAAASTGDLAVSWQCNNLRSASGYLYQQASGDSAAGGSISLLNTGVLDRMVFRNADGFQFYGDMSGTTLGDVYAGVYSGTGYYLSGDLDTGIFSGGANILAFETGGTGCAYFDTNGHLLPGTGDTFNLGNSGNRWNYLYVNNLNTKSILPASDSDWTIGVTGNRYYRGWFDELYVTAGAVSGSDSRLKTDIADSDLGLDFIASLRPRRYRMKDRQVVTRDEAGAENRRTIPGIRPHYGFVAQEIKKAMGPADFAGYVDIDLTGEQLGLRYEEFIAPMVKAMQELHGQVKEERQARLALEQRLAALEMALGPIAIK